MPFSFSVFGAKRLGTGKYLTCCSAPDIDHQFDWPKYRDSELSSYGTTREAVETLPNCILSFISPDDGNNGTFRGCNRVMLHT